jgi:hypothetical protein
MVLVTVASCGRAYWLKSPAGRLPDTASAWESIGGLAVQKAAPHFAEVRVGPEFAHTRTNRNRTVAPAHIADWSHSCGRTALEARPLVISPAARSRTGLRSLRSATFLKGPFRMSYGLKPSCRHSGQEIAASSPRIIRTGV